MTKYFKLSAPEDVLRAISFLKSLSLAKVWTLEIKLYRKDRSSAQNKLLWMWLTIIGNELGYTKDEIYEEMVDLYLPMIEMRRFNGEKREVRLTTSKLNTKEFTEFLSNIDLFASGMGIILPHPEDLMWEAMGVKG